VSVTATRTPTQVRQLGQSVTIIDRDQIASTGAQTLADVLERVPGLTVTQSSSFGSNTGLFARGGESDFTMVLVDGIKVNHTGGLIDLSDFNLSNVERIEIVRGPGSVLYGSDSATATIHIITAKGEGDPSGSFGFDFGNYGSSTYYGTVSGGSPIFNYSLGARYFDSDGLHSFNNQYRVGNLSFRGDLATSSSSTLTASVRHQNGRYHFPTNSVGEVVDPNDFQVSRDSVYSVSYRHQLHSTFSTELQFGHHNRDFVAVHPPNSVDDVVASRFETIESRNYLNWQNNLWLGSNHQLTLGASYQREEAEIDNLRRRSIGVYLQDQFAIGQRLFLTAGIRHEDNDRFNNFVSGALSVSYLVSELLKVRSSVGTGFRAPSFIEIAGLPGAGIHGNEQLDPERNVSFDVGLDSLTADGRFRASGTFFLNRFSDLIEFTFLVPPGSPNYLNIERAKSLGAELETSYEIRQGLLLGGQYTLTSTRVTDAGTTPGGNFEQGMALLRRPLHSGGMFVEVPIRESRWRLDLLYKGKRDDIEFLPDFSSRRISLPSYWRLDLSTRVPVSTFADGKSRLFWIVRGQNLLNRYYQEIAGFRAMGRSLSTGLEFGF